MDFKKLSKPELEAKLTDVTSQYLKEKVQLRAQLDDLKDEHKAVVADLKAEIKALRAELKDLKNH